jgi:hypothetical protein
VDLAESSALEAILEARVEKKRGKKAIWVSLDDFGNVARSSYSGRAEVSRQSV